MLVILILLLFILFSIFYLVFRSKEEFDLTAAFIDLTTFDESDKYMYGS